MKLFCRTVLSVLIAFFTSDASFATGICGFKPINLSCELRVNPLGIDVSNPNFSYVLNALTKNERALKQSAYQILVSDTPDFSPASNGIFWDSGKVKTDQMAYLIYKGKPLLSSQKYWWKVRVWDQNGNKSAWSPTANWTMGILNATDWKAKWISVAGADKFALTPFGFKSQESTTESEVKWVQVDLGQAISVSQVSLFPLFYNDHAGYAFPLRFKIEAANDATFKTKVLLTDQTTSDFRNPRFSPVHFTAKNTTCRFIRLTVTKLPKIGSDYVFALRQIVVMSAGKNIAAGKNVEASDSDESNGFTKNNLTDMLSNNAASPNYTSILLRKEFKVKPALLRAVIQISGLSQYELNLNGKKVGDLLLTPGWTDYRKTVLYNTYDVTKQLQNGNNAIGIILGNGMYNIQPDTLRYVKFLNSFGPAKAIAQLQLLYADGSVELINTDKTWQVSPGPITYSNVFGGEDYNSNLEEKGWDKPDFKPAKNWIAAIEIAGPGGSLKGLSGSAPPIKAIDTLNAVTITRIKDNLWIYDYGQNAAMIPVLNVSGLKGSSVRIIPSELLGKNGLADRASATQDGVRPAWWQYTLSGQGEEKWFPKFFYQGARYLQVELFPADSGGKLPEVKLLQDVIVHSSSTPVGSFSCSNKLFNATYNLVRWAQRSNMMSLMTDCPQREKLGWLEENHLNGPSLRYNFNMAPLFRKTMNDMADAQLENGFVPNIAPEYFIAGPSSLSNGFRNSPEWGSSFIIVPWQQYLFSSDISLLKNYYDRMKRYLSFLSGEAKNNIIQTGLGDWYDIGPKPSWGSQLTPVSFTATAIYYYDNWIMHRIALALGKQEDALYYSAAASKIRTAFNHQFFQSATGQYATGSQTCNAMPLFFNLVESQNRRKILNALVTDIRNRDNSFTSGEVGYRFLLRALAQEGRSDVVFDMNNQSEKPGYGYQLKMGATSLTEKWDASVGSFGSQNHFMSGQINEWFFNDLVGISADEKGVGFKKFIINPSVLKSLDWVKGSYASASGNIHCAWFRKKRKLVLAVSIPPNTSATVYIPSGNAKQIFEGKTKAFTVVGVKFLKIENRKCVFAVASGNYHFTSTL